MYVCVYVCLKESVRVCACDHMNEAGLRGRCPAWHSSQVKTDATFKRVTTTSRYPVTTLNRTVSLCISLTLFPPSLLHSFHFRSVPQLVFINFFPHFSIPLYWFLVSIAPFFLSSSHLSTGYLEGQAGRSIR